LKVLFGAISINPKNNSIFTLQTSRFFSLGRKKPTETRVHGGK
jgi:hypothetical protein